MLAIVAQLHHLATIRLSDINHPGIPALLNLSFVKEAETALLGDRRSCFSRHLFHDAVDGSAIGTHSHHTRWCEHHCKSNGTRPHGLPKRIPSDDTIKDTILI